MTGHSQLLFSGERMPPEKRHTSEGEPIYVSAQGVPLAWIFVFGSRNVWDVGDNVKARGGVVGERNPFETTVETALVRLEHARDTLDDHEFAWPWFSPLMMLERKLRLRPKNGFLRLAAPWVPELADDQRAEWQSATAYLENYVNFLNSGRHRDAVLSIRRLEAFCPFIPEAHREDDRRFRKVQLHRRETDPAVRLALLMLGEPPQKPEMFRKAAERDVAPLLAELAQKDPPPNPLQQQTATAETAAGRAPLIQRLSRMFRRD